MEFWLASYPRSGNSYFRIVLRKRYDIPSSDGERQEALEPKSLECTLPARSPSEKQAAPAIQGLKTHRPPEDGDTRPAIYIVRDGRDSLVSYAYYSLLIFHNTAEADVPLEVLQKTISDLILETNSAYRTWSQNVEAWAARQNTVVCRFEDLVTKPARVVDRAVAALGLKVPVVSQEVPTFTELNSVDPKFFRKGQRGEWQNIFTPELHDLFWQHNGETMIRFGYPQTPAEQRKVA